MYWGCGIPHLTSVDAMSKQVFLFSMRILSYQYALFSSRMSFKLKVILFLAWMSSGGYSFNINQLNVFEDVYHCKDDNDISTHRVLVLSPHDEYYTPLFVKYFNGRVDILPNTPHKRKKTKSKTTQLVRQIPLIEKFQIYQIGLFGLHTDIF